ncbi:MAG: glycosyltransferase family 4 protein [Chloroflexi bacterium]|nr:glycosyltransferase family 4 protein [Chloroflexota bacterium]
MRIVLVDSWLPTTAAGTGTTAGIRGLRAGLLALGHEVVTLRPQGAPRGSLTLHRLLFNLAVPRVIATVPADLVIGFDFDGFRWAGQRRTVPYVVSIKGVAAEERQYERGWVRALFGLFAALEGLNARRADGVVVTSRYCAEAVVQHYRVDPVRLRIVPEGIDLARWRQPLPAAGDGATILCVARQYPRKRVADLLHALVAVRREVPAAHAVIVGDGPEHAALRKLAAQLGLEGAVRFTGALSDEQVQACYRQADLFCLPSVQEGFGIVFLEAMASGLPIVATTAAAVPEVVPAGRAGLLVPPGNVPALAEALTSLLGAPDQRRAFAAFGQDYVARFDWPLVAQHLLAELERPASVSGQR